MNVREVCEWWVRDTGTPGSPVVGVWRPGLPGGELVWCSPGKPVTTPGRPAWELLLWRPGAPVVTSPWRPGLPEETVWFCRPGEAPVGAVPEDGGEKHHFTQHDYRLFL